MAHQRAGIGAVVVSDGSGAVRSHHVGIEIHQALSGDRRRSRSHAVRGVANRTAESILIGMQIVLREAGVRENLGQIVALRAHREGSGDAGIGIGEKIRDRSAGNCRLAELIVALENVRVDRPVRTIRSGAAELAIVVAVVAIGAEVLGAHQPRRRQSLLVQHVHQQARLRQRAASIMSDRMAGGCRRRKFRNDVQRIWCRHHSRRSVSVNDQSLLAGAGAVTTQTSFILIDGRNDRGNAIERADAGRARLRRPNGGRRGKLQFRVGSMRAVAIHTSRMPVVVEQRRLGGIVEVIARRQGMTYLRDLGHDVGNRGRQIRSSAMAGHASLGHGIVRGSRGRGGSQQACRSNRIMRHVARRARIHADGRISTGVRVRRNLVRSRLVDAVRESCQRIDLSLHHAVRIVTRQTHLRVRTVAHQKVLGNFVDVLNVGVVATGAFDVAVDQLYRSGGIGRLALCDQRRNQVRGIFQRQHQTEWVRSRQSGAERIGAIHGSDRGQLPVGRGLSHAHRPVMTTQAQTAGDTQRGLSVAQVGIGRAAVRHVGFLRQLLVP